MNSQIVPVKSIDPVNFHYHVGAPVLRVFDTNGAGHLIPVAYQSAGLTFNLMFAPYGQIYAEVAI
jgi:hypothetical protein